MTVELNGAAIELPEGASVADAVGRLGTAAEGRGIAVAVDGEVVPRSAWSSTGLSDGQRIEIVGAVQGG